MTSLLRVSAIFALLCSSQTASFAESKPVELKWSELSRLIQNRRVELMLVDGTKLKGEAVVVREDSIVVGNASVPRASVSLIQAGKSHAGRSPAAAAWFLGQKAGDGDRRSERACCRRIRYSSCHRLRWRRNTIVSRNGIRRDTRWLLPWERNRPSDYADQDRAMNKLAVTCIQYSVQPLPVQSGIRRRPS